MPFESALQALARRGVLPTSLGSSDLSALGANFHRQNFVSAKTLLTDLLDAYKEKVGTVLNPVDISRPDRVTESNPAGRVQVGTDLATARLQIRELQAKLGYTPDPDAAGSLTDLSSDARINLVLRTNTQLAQGAGNFIRSNDPALLDLWPAQELYRLEARDKVRDWEQRWMEAAGYASDPAAAAALQAHGRMVALKSSGIWQALGDSWDDSLGNPYPPFAFGSGMWTREISRDEAEQFGLITSEQEARPNPLDISSLFEEVAA
jgi:hypothetical protein